MRAFVSLVIILTACRAEPGPEEPRTSPADDVRGEVERVLDRAFARITQLTDSIDDALKPVPLLTGAEEGELRRYGNDDHLVRARSLGARPGDSAGIGPLRAAGRLVQLEDSTTLWVVRELDHSQPYVTPDARALLVSIAEQFQARLAELGLPPYRLEVTSVLRTAESQADLRQSNPNAAAGTSTHEYGTTLDIAYSSVAAPADPELGIDMGAVPWLEPRVDRFVGAMLETAAARKSRELQAVLGHVLRDLQKRGDVMVTLERRQPVYHITVARAQGS